MAGFFGFFDYTKPGPGIPKDAPPKPRILVFLGVFKRKFWNLVKLNLMFSLFNLPAIILAWLSTFIFFQQKFSDDYLLEFFVRLMFAAFIVSIPILTVGPAQAGFTYVLRNYAREEHAFIWGDFKEKALNNFKQSSMIALVDLFVVIILAVDINAYRSMSQGNLLMTIASTMIGIMTLIYTMMHMYMYPMLVTFKLTNRQLFKNAFIFAIIRFFPNLGILILCGLFIVLTFILPNVGLLLFFTITVSTVGLITNFYVYPALKKYIMIEPEQQKGTADEASCEEDGPVCEDKI